MGVKLRYGRAFEIGGGERLVHVGGDYSRRWVGDDPARVTARPESNLAPVLVGTRLLLADRTDTLMLEGAFANGPFSLQSEYALKRRRMLKTENPLFKSLYVMATYSITGEQRVHDRDALEGAVDLGFVAVRRMGTEGGGEKRIDDLFEARQQHAVDLHINNCLRAPG